MAIRTNTRLARGLFLERDIERLRRQLALFNGFLSRKKSVTSLVDLDAACEETIGQVFGETSEFVEAYEYAKLGEAASLVNLPEEAQESGAQDIERESMQQRKQVLESCITALEGIRHNGRR